jgi:hypothetical protein
MGFYSRNISLIGSEIDQNKPGVYDLNSRRLYPYVDDQLYPLNSALSSYTNTSDVATVVAEIENKGYTVIATPVYQAMAEALQGTNSTISTTGRFRYDIFDETNELALTSSYGDLQDDRPYIGFAGFANNSYLGILLTSYTGYGSGTQLKNLFYPNQVRNLQAFWLQPDGTETSYTVPNSRTWFSDNQQPNTNGYNSTTRFSADDGTWGYAPGLTLDGNGGQYVGSGSGNFGINNANSNDSSASILYWNGAAQTGNNYKLYVFIKKVE